MSFSRDAVMLVLCMLLGAAIQLLITDLYFAHNLTITNTFENQQYLANVDSSKQCANKSWDDYLVIKIPHETGSMRPYIYAGDTLLLVDYNESIPLVIGDVVGHNSALHRVVSINLKQGTFFTKGDNNRFPDSEVRLINKTKYVVCGVMRR